MRGSLQKVVPKPGTKSRLRLPKGQNAWNIILPLGRGADGKHKQRWVRFHGTRKMAEQKLNELTGELHRGEFIEPSKMTVGAWLDEWLDKAIRTPRRAPLTYTTYAGVVKNYLKPAFGHVLLQQLTSLQVERYYADSKLASRTVAVHHAILTTALKAAVTSGILRHNVANRATNKPNMRTTTSDVRKNCWSRDEAFTFLATVRHEGNAHNLAFFALALDGGLRIGELLGLRWTDLEGNTLSVDRQLLKRGKDEETGEDCLITSLPKTRRTLRMDLSEETVSLLREHKRQQAELKLKNRLRYADHGLIFAQQWEQMQSKHATLGWPLNRTSVGTMLTRLCKAADVKRISPHGMRHTCATLLLLAGVQPHVVQRRLGHASVEMTLNVYSHVLPSMESDAASRLSKLLHG